MSPGGLRNGPLGAFAVIWAPFGTLRRVADGRRALPGFAVVTACAALGFVTSTAFALTGTTRRQFERPWLPAGFVDDLAEAVEVGAPVLALLGPFAVWLSVALLMQFTTRSFGGRGSLSSMLGVVGVAQTPLLVGGALVALLAALQPLAGTALGAALGYLISLLSFALSLWYVALVVIGASLARGVGYGESAGACALSCVGLGILIIVLVVMAGVGVFTVVGMTQR